MEWTFDDNRAIYSQIIEQMKLFIVSGTLSPGERVPSVRELAAAAKVNPNTMQKALAELERNELMFSNRTSGRFITEDKKKIEQVREELAENTIISFIRNMQQLGFEKEKTQQLLQKYGEEMILNE